MRYDLFVAPLGETMKWLQDFDNKSDALISFNMCVESGKMGAVFLDERSASGSTNLRKWRKGKNANKAKGQSG
jgi:hypothetical protein